MAIKTASELATKCKEVATKYKTLYVMGCFGAPMNKSNKERYCNNHDYNKKPTRTAMIQAATADTFGFDCVGLIKSLLWGWSGDKNLKYGGASYTSNNVPDCSADGMIKLCKEVSTDFSKIEVGEAVWVSGHIGVYIGDGLAVECTPSWGNGVQITACNCSKTGYNRRDWTKHGKMPYVTYDKKTATESEKKPDTTPVNNVTYFERYTGSSTSIVSALKAIGENSSYEHRAKIAKANGINGYSGTAEQNSTMRKLLQQGKLIKPTDNTAYFKKYVGDSVSIVSALNSIGVTSTFAYRRQIAAVNNIKLYVGTSAQNKTMLNLLKQGKLIKP